MSASPTLVQKNRIMMGQVLSTGFLTRPLEACSSKIVRLGSKFVSLECGELSILSDIEGVSVFTTEIPIDENLRVVDFIAQQHSFSVFIAQQHGFSIFILAYVAVSGLMVSTGLM